MSIQAIITSSIHGALHYTLDYNLKLSWISAILTASVGHIVELIVVSVFITAAIDECFY